MEAMTRQEWKREKRRLWWRKNEDAVIVFVLALLCVGTIAAILKL